MTYTQEDLDKHLSEYHQISVWSDYVKELVYGGTDGIVTTFAVVAGFSGAYLSSETTIQLSILSVLLFGLANLFADGLAMGLGNFISLRAEQNMILSQKEKEWQEILTNPEEEEKETLFLLQKKGFNKDDAQTMTNLMKKNKPYWLEFMMTEELDLPSSPNLNPALNGVMTFLSFCSFGFIPILPYLFMTDAVSAFKVSCLSTLFALILLGFLSGKVSKRKQIQTIFETVLVGTTAATVAYLVGSFFS